MNDSIIQLSRFEYDEMLKEIKTKPYIAWKYAFENRIDSIEAHRLTKQRINETEWLKKV